MPEHDDPARDTQQFRRFVQTDQNDSAAGRAHVRAYVGVGAAVLVVIALVAFLLI